MKTLLIVSSLFFSTISIAQETTNSAEQKPAEAKPSEFKQPESTPPQEVDKSQIRIGMSVHLSLADKLTFKDASTTSGGLTSSGDIDFSTHSALGVGLNLINSRPQAWGFSGSLFYEFPRDIESFTASDSTGSSTGFYVSPKPKIALMVLEGDAIYRWENVYLPFGLNYSIPTFTPGVGATRPLDFKGDVGIQVGLGAWSGENLSFDFKIRSIAVKASGATSTLTADFGTGTLTGLAIGLNYWFK